MGIRDLKSSILPFLLGLGIWLVPVPNGLEPEAWHLFAIFLATIFAIILKPMPMPVIALTGLGLAIITDTLSFNEAFSGFGHPVIWLIVFAYFVAHGIIKTGLGARISYLFLLFLGRKSLGLSYGLASTDLLLSPAIPSATARCGGIILPIIESLCVNYDSHPHHPSARKIGSFLTLVSFQINCVTNAMFLTAMSANPLVFDIVSEIGVDMSWGNWALAAIVPGLLSFFLIPIIIYFIHPPQIQSTPKAPEFAREKLIKMGPISSKEWIMITVFILLVVLWITGPIIHVKPTTTALIGLVILLWAKVIYWKDLLKEEDAWNTLIWFSVLLMMAMQLNRLGFMSWFSELVVYEIQNFDTIIAFGILILTYFYSHYFFASNIAHVGAMLAPFLFVSVKLGVPATLSAYLLGYMSSLFGGLTHYGSGPGAVLFGAGFTSIKSWWKVGIIISFVNLVVWLTVGLAWWKFLGLW